MMLMYVDVKKNLKLKTTETITNEAKVVCITWDEPAAPFKQASGLYKHSPFRYMHAKNTKCETTTAPKT